MLSILLTLVIIACSIVAIIWLFNMMVDCENLIEDVMLGIGNKMNFVMCGKNRNE